MVEIVTAEFGFGMVAGMFASIFLAIIVAQIQQKCRPKSSGEPEPKSSIVRQSSESSHGRLGSVSNAVNEKVSRLGSVSIAVNESVSSYTGSDEYRFGDITRATVKKVGSKIKVRKLVLAPPSGEPESPPTYPAAMPSITSGVVAAEFQTSGFYSTKKGRFASALARERAQRPLRTRSVAARWRVLTSRLRSLVSQCARLRSSTRPKCSSRGTCTRRCASSVSPSRR